MVMLSPARLAVLALTAGALSAQQPWQHLQMPRIADVAAHFESPPPEYGPEPYYGFGGPMNLAVITRDLDTIKALGYTAVTVQAGFGLPEPYLSDGYFRLFRTLVEEAKKRDLRVWIVDDAGYPSGFAGGKFTEQQSTLRMQALVARKLDVTASQKVEQPLDPATVSVAARNLDTGELDPLPFPNNTVSWTVPSGRWQLIVVEHAFRTSPTRSDTNPKRTKDTTQSLEDYLNPEATRQYLAFTHEQYRKYVGDEFGKTILGFRGDEPDYSISGLPWTPRLFETFETIKGYDVRPYLAAFFDRNLTNLTETQHRAKADYWDVWSRLFRDGFFKVQGDWCATHHLEYQVHLNHEEALMNLARSEGDFFRDMRYVQVPGIDTIWHQIWYDTVSDFPKLASSAAHLNGRPRAFTESFAAYRPTPDIEQAKYILDEQFVRGVNLVEVMYFPSTSKGPRPPPTFQADPGFPALMHYTRRLSYVLSMGKPTASIGIYIPTASMWLGDAAANDTFLAVEHRLLENQRDFDVVDEDALSSELIAGKGVFRTLSGNELRTILIPGADVVTQGAYDRLCAFATAGGNVIFIGKTPSIIEQKSFLQAQKAGLKAQSTEKDFSWARVEQLTDLSPAQLATLSAPDLALRSPAPGLRYIRRALRDGDIWFFFNESGQPLQTAASMKGHRQEIWNPETGAIRSEPGPGSTIELSLAPCETKLVVTRK
jgi:alpha-L-rhamnosidase